MPWRRWATATMLAWSGLRHHYRRVEGLGEFTGPLASVQRWLRLRCTLVARRADKKSTPAKFKLGKTPLWVAPLASSATARSGGPGATRPCSAGCTRRSASRMGSGISWRRGPVQGHVSNSGEHIPFRPLPPNGCCLRIVPLGRIQGVNHAGRFPKSWRSIGKFGVGACAALYTLMRSNRVAPFPDRCFIGNRPAPRLCE